MGTEEENKGPRGDREIRFGEYAFYPARGVLLRDGVRVKIGSRAIALLEALVQRPGETVGYAELMRAGGPAFMSMMLT